MKFLKMNNVQRLTSPRTCNRATQYFGPHHIQQRLVSMDYLKVGRCGLPVSSSREDQTINEMPHTKRNGQKTN